MIGDIMQRGAPVGMPIFVAKSIMVTSRNDGSPRLRFGLVLEHRRNRTRLGLVCPPN